MIVLHDSYSADLSHVQAMADMEEGFRLFDYVFIEQQNNSFWIGQIVQPNQNISTVGDRLDATILHGLKLMQTNPNIQSIESIQIFDILILGQYNHNRLSTPRIRPLPGAKITHLNSEDTISVIELPTYRQYAEGRCNVIGELLNADEVPLCITPQKYNFHVMIAGGTGSGKSNVAANLIAQAVLHGNCVLVHDAKPDYRFISSVNTDQSGVTLLKERFSKYGMQPQGVENVLKLGFYGKCDPTAVDHVVGFRASDFEPEILAGLFFNESGEQNQFEGFAAAAQSLRRNISIIENSAPIYSLEDILSEVVARANGRSPIEPAEIIHEMTARTILRKVRTRSSAMPWLDSTGKDIGKNRLPGLRRSSLDLSPARSHAVVEKFDLSRYVRREQVIVIDYSQMDEASYALILSYFLHVCQQYRRNWGEVGIVQLVDEAHRIFDNESRYNNSLSRAFERVMREGRSVDHSIILSLQNASQIPPRVMNNLNTKIVMHQNSKYEADAATQTMGREFSVQTMRLGTGQALVSMHESRAVVLAQMAPSPMELMRSDNMGSTL